MELQGKIIRPLAYYDNPGTKLQISFAELNKLSGIASSTGTVDYAVSASTAAQATTAVAAAYAASAGALSGVTASAAQINKILYGTSLFKYAIGSVVASNGYVMTHGLATGLYCMVNPQTSGILANGKVSGTSIQFSILGDTGLFFESTSAVVDFIIIGNS